MVSVIPIVKSRVFFVLILATSLRVSTPFVQACDIDNILEGGFVWPGQEETKFLHKSGYARPGIALFDSVHSFDALHYALDLNFPMDGPYFEGSMTLRFQVVDDSISSITLHMVHLVADSALVGNDPTTYIRDDSTITVDLDGYRHAPETLSLTVHYHDYTANRGYYYYPRNAYTMTEPQDARWWFPCFDEPWDKATSEIFATVPEDYDVGSNGWLESVDHDQQNHTRTYHWVSDDQIATYLIDLIMADYAVWNDYYIAGPDDSIAILNMVYAEDSTDAVYDFGNVPAMMEIFSGLFYPYPFNKYGQGTVEPFAFGGMEHQTMSTLHRNWIQGDRSREGGISHELAHMWWGDFVTMSDWRHIWLNEGFATYSSALFNESFYGPQRFNENMEAYRQAYLVYVDIFGHEPLYDPDYLFATPEYYKGAWVLHMLRGIIGDYAFFGGLHYYASLYGYGNASTWEFADAMETISGVELDWFFEEWIFGQAHPIYQYAWSYSGEGPYTVHLEILQAQDEAPSFRMPIEIEILSEQESYEFVIENQHEYQVYDFTISSLPTDLMLDPDNWILKETEQVTEIDDHYPPQLPMRAGLMNVYPNPFNSSTNISFFVEGERQVLDIAIYDISGRLVKKIGSSEYSPGIHTIAWDGTNENSDILSSGVYIVKMASPVGTSSKKLTLIK
jgi:aminopeptidase N